MEPLAANNQPVSSESATRKPKTVKIQPYDTYKYDELHHITEWKDGRIYKTKTTGKFVPTGENPDPKKYVLSSISTKLTRGKDPIELPLFEGE